MASTSMPSIPSVPLISASPSLAISVTGSMPASPSAWAAASRRAARVGDLALADQHERAVRERREVAARAERPVLGHDRGDPGVEQREHRLGQQRPRAGAAHRERARAQQHHRPDDLGLDRRAHPGGVRAHERALQLLAALDGDRDVGERAEAGRDAVGRLLAAGQPLDDRRARLHRAPRLGRERHGLPVAGHGDDVLRRQSGAGQLDHASKTVFREPGAGPGRCPGSRRCRSGRRPWDGRSPSGRPAHERPLGRGRHRGRRADPRPA